MKTLEFIPVVLFFLVYKMPEKIISFISPLISDQSEVFLRNTKAFILATVVIMIATIIQIALNWFVKKKIDKMSIVILALILLLGLPSILLDNPILFMWKPTIANWLFAIAFFGSKYVGRRIPIIQRMLGEQIQLPAVIWKKLNYAWISFFIVSGGLNLYVAYNFSENAWVNFKLYGILGLTLLFALAQGVFLAKYMQEPEEKNEKIES